MVIGTVSGLVCSFSRSEPSTRTSTGSSFLGMRVDIPGSYRTAGKRKRPLDFRLEKCHSLLKLPNRHTDKVGRGFTRHSPATRSPCSNRFILHTFLDNDEDPQ